MGQVTSFILGPSLPWVPALLGSPWWVGSPPPHPRLRLVAPSLQNVRSSGSSVLSADEFQKLFYQFDRRISKEVRRRQRGMGVRGGLCGSQFTVCPGSSPVWGQLAWVMPQTRAGASPQDSCSQTLVLWLGPLGPHTRSSQAHPLCLAILVPLLTGPGVGNP